MIIPGAAPAAAQDATAAPSIQDAPATGDRPSRDEVVVVTASRREEQLLNAPATMTVITEDEIATAAARTVPDLLRLVPGVNVARTSVRDVNVTTRAATGTLSDSMLVLLDGRSIYQDFFGFVMWDFLPVDVAEIKQVEVIRGPASAVWGANAMTGVVNVITKTPREMAGTTVGIRFGQFDRSAPGGRFDGGGLLSITAAHTRVTNDRFAYKVSAGMLAEESLLRPTGTVPGSGRAYPSFDNPGTLQPRLDARADYDLADGQRRLVLAGGIAGTEGIIHTGLGPLDIQRGSTFKYGRITFTRRKMKVQAFVNAIDGESPASLLTAADGRPAQFRFEDQAYDVEFSDLRLIGAHHLLSYGGNYRHNNFNLSFAPRGHRRDEGGAYVQDEIFLTARYRWVIGSRVDGFDVLERPIVSPRTTFLIKPTASQTFRLSFNRAFRAPSFVDSFLETSFLNEIDLGPAGAFHFPAFAGGNPALRQEALTAYEAGSWPTSVAPHSAWRRT
jgi:iron complex outermembrane receptor protein